jgi:hypothetical protein
MFKITNEVLLFIGVLVFLFVALGYLMSCMGGKREFEAFDETTEAPMMEEEPDEEDDETDDEDDETDDDETDDETDAEDN